MAKKRDPSIIQSVQRAFKVLFLFSREHPRWRVSELSNALQLHPSTVSRLLTTLVAQGVLRRNPSTREYELSMRVLALAEAALSQMDLVKLALPVMTELTHRANETSFLVILDGIWAVTVAQVTADRRMTSPYYVGRGYQLHCTTGGKLFLAYGPESRLDELIKAGPIKHTEHTMVERDELLAELARIRQQGYAVANQESEIGLLAIGAPIRDRHGEVVAGISISGPPVRMNGDRSPELLHAVLDAARQVSSALGWSGDDND